MILPESKFLIAQHNPEYINPYGEKLLSKLFWPVVFKKGGLKFWAIMAEKYGMPFLLGKQPRGINPEETRDFVNQLSKMTKDAVAVIPDDATVEFLENNRTSSGDLYLQFLNFLNAEMSKAVLGQTQTTEITGGSGSLASSKTHSEKLKTIYDEDQKLVETVINQLIKYICDLNFNTAEYPQFIMFEKEEVDKLLADRDKVLTEINVKFNKDYFVENYGLKPEHFEIAEAVMGSAGTGKIIKADKVQTGTNPKTAEAVASDVSKPVANFAEPIIKPTPDEQITSILPDKALQMQLEQTLKPIMDLINNAVDYSEIIEKLSQIYPKMKTTQIEDLLTKAIFLTEIQGMEDAKV
jgi:phage gp29-like protein